MDTFTLDPAPLRRIAADLEEAARAVDRRTDVALPPRLPFPGDSRDGIDRLVGAATRVSRAATSAADDLDRLLADGRTTDDAVARSFLELPWRPGAEGAR